MVNQISSHVSLGPRARGTEIAHADDARDADGVRGLPLTVSVRDESP